MSTYSAAFGRLMTSIVTNAEILPRDEWAYLTSEIDCSINEGENRTTFAVTGPLLRNGWIELHRRIDEYALTRPFPFVVMDLSDADLPAGDGLLDVMKASWGPKADCRLALVVPERSYSAAWAWCLARCGEGSSCVSFWKGDSVSRWEQSCIEWRERQLAMARRSEGPQTTKTSRSTRGRRATGHK